MEGGDDPQTIFETLNSRGVDLSAGDLMRNFIFQRAKGLGQEHGSLNVDKLYSEHWLPLDRWFWREEDNRRRQTKPRLDWLLVDHLSMKRAEVVSVEQLFESYRRWILNETPFSSVEQELQSISSSAAIHRRIAEQRPVPGFEHVTEDEIDVDQLAREVEREQAINKLGNLTLLTHSLNATVSNGPFSVKMPAVRAHASLTLNRELS